MLTKGTYERFMGFSFKIQVNRYTQICQRVRLELRGHLFNELQTETETTSNTERKCLANIWDRKVIFD